MDIGELIKSGADVNKTDNDDQNTLFEAVQQRDDVEFVRALIESGADVKKCGLNGQTALFYAVQQTNNKNMVQALIESGADVNKTDDFGQTALFYAVKQSNNENSVRALIESGADVDITDDYGQSALFVAVQQSNNENVVRALIESDADVNKTDDVGQTALFYAVQQSNNGNVVRALIDAGSGVLNTRDVYGRSPMFYAWKCPITLRYLLENEGNPYLHLQKDNCNVSMLTFFIEKCISFSYLPPVKHDVMPEHFDLLIKHGVKHEDIAKTIINLMFVKIFDPFKESMVLTLANIYKNHFTDRSDVKDKMKIIEDIRRFEALELLFELGADPNSADSQGNTALHYFSLLPIFHKDTDETFDMTKFHNLERFGMSFSMKNHEGQTPLMFCLSNLHRQYGITELWTFDLFLSWFIKSLFKVCTFLVNHGSSIEETSRSGESVFHLIIRLFRKCLMVPGKDLEIIEKRNIGRRIVWNEAIKFLSLFPPAIVARGKIVNKPDADLNTPLHFWAKLQSISFQDYSRSTIEDLSFFETFLKTTLQYFLDCKAKLNSRNENEETPLHLCQTWSAVKLLVDAGANPKDVDSSGRSVLLVAAKNKIFRTNPTNPTNPKCFYPDVSEDPKSFWNTALEKGLDPWTVDHQDESVLGLLIESEAYVLAKALVDMACEKNYIQSETIAVSLLHAICKDKSTRTHWKTGLVQDLLKKRRFPTTATTPLLFCCCSHLIELCTFDERSVHWEIAELLLSSGADPRIINSSGKSCLDIAGTYPALKDLLTKPIDINIITLVIPWTIVSKRYESKLEEVARRREVEVVGPFWYHKESIGSGSFGRVFAGINEDGREVAIKRVERLRMNRPEVKREITNLIALADCEQVVRYLFFFQEKEFSYVVLELMEGNLDDCIKESFFRNKTLELSKDVVIGVKFLHEKNILHRDIKPGNILYKTHPKQCLKIADFGLSRRIESTDSSSVYGTNAGTRCWIAPEVLMCPQDNSKSSDVFSCGLVLHYILSVKKHPFSKNNKQVAHEIERNITKGKMKGWDDSLSPEATHLLKTMLENDRNNRPIAREALDHPLFWSQERKIDLLIAVGNQPVFEYPRAGKSTCLTPVETDLEKSCSTIVRYGKWNDPGYLHMPAIYTEMTQKRKSYDTTSAVELVRFIRNAYSHVSEDKRPTSIRKLLLEDFVFLDYFPHLVMEVYKAVTTHGWDQTRDEIKYAMNK